MHKWGLHSVVALFAALVLFAPTSALAGSADDPQPRGRVLDRSGHGTAVIEKLGARLPQVAAQNKMSADQLRSILEEDHSAWVGPDGQMFYVEEMEALEGTPTPMPLTTTYPASQTFALHSLPGSSHVIYLDFNGAAVSGTWWNQYGGMPSRTYTGFSLDSNPGTFTSAELAYIQQVWRMVAEKFAPFDVDVTTADPGPAGYNRNGSTDQTYGDHVVITDDPIAVQTACGSCSGVALLDTFDNTWRTDSYLEPAWVFSSKTSGSPILTAHTVAHEVGHTFGLHHDGDTSGHEYHSGHGNWFPIMGSSAKAVGQFSKGEYAGANNTEDDLAMIAANGAPVRADDHGSDLASADKLGTAATYTQNGVISARSDRDVFAIEHPCTDDITAVATGVGAGATLDVSLQVLDSAGTVVGTANPTSGQTSAWPATPTGMGASLTVPAGSGTYYVRVDGVGKGSPATDGYSDYDSLGAYRLTIAGCGGTITIPAGTTTTTAPSSPRIGLATSGRRGRPYTATARWSVPASTGGATISGYRVRAQRLDSAGRVIKVVSSRLLSADSQRLKMSLPKGRYRFRVVAYNRVGSSPVSAASRIVTAR